jgi:hypothetical protein
VTTPLVAHYRNRTGTVHALIVADPDEADRVGRQLRAVCGFMLTAYRSQTSDNVTCGVCRRRFR